MGVEIRLKPDATSEMRPPALTSETGRPAHTSEASGAEPTQGAHVGSGVSRTVTSWRVWLGALIVVTAVVSFQVRVGRRMPDFQVLRVVGHRVLAGEELYRPSDGHWLYKYLPAFGFVVSPLSLLPAPAEARTFEPRGRTYNPWSDTARVLWFFGAVVLLVVMLAMSLRLLPDRKRRAGAIVGVTILALGKFYAHELELGQCNLLLTMGVLLALLAWRRDRPATAGMLLAAATVVKPYTIVFLPYLAARRQWRALGGFALALALAVFLPALRYGFHENLALLRGWWVTVTTSTPPNLDVSDNISIAAMYAKWFGVGTLASRLALATAGVLLAACAWVLLRRPRIRFPEYLDAALLLTLIPLLSPQGWDYVLLIATPAVMLLVNNLGCFPRPVRWIAVGCLLVPGLTLWDIVGRPAYTLFMVSSVVTFCYLFAVVLLLRLRRMNAA